MGWVRERGRTTGVLVALVLMAGVATSGGAYLAVEAGEDRYAAQMMDGYASLITDAVQDQVSRYGDTLTDMAFAIGAQAELTGEDFARITAGLDAKRLSGAGTIAFVVPSAPAEVTAVQRRWRDRGATGLRLRPAADVPKHAFLIFEKAFDDREDMAGTDLAISMELTTVLHTAQRSGGLAISSPYRLVRDRALPESQQQMSVTLATPVYAALGSPGPDEFAGWMIMGLRGQDLLAQTFLDHGQSAVQVGLTDTTDGATLAAVAPSSRIDDTALERTTGVLAGQRHWQISMWPTRRLAAAADRGLSGLTAAAGLALSVLLAAMTAVLTGSRNRALEQVERATAELRLDIRRREEVETKLRESEEQLRHLAFHDPLTGLANRLLFYDRLDHALATHTRGHRVFAVLFIDLDGFKQINDLLGHDAGDTVLRVTADRLRSGLRATDTVARFGGDEFAIILEDLAHAEDARPTARRVIESLQEPIDVDGGPARVSASVGIAINTVGSTASDIMRDADTAMYAAKAGGKNRYAEAAARASGSLDGY